MGIEHRGLVTGRGRFTLRAGAGGRTRSPGPKQLHVPVVDGRAGRRARRAKPVLRAIWRRNLRRLKAIVGGRNA